MTTRHSSVVAALCALRERHGGVLPPDVDQVVRYYVGAKAEAERAAEHVLAMIRAQVA